MILMTEVQLVDSSKKTENGGDKGILEPRSEWFWDLNRIDSV